MSTPDRRAGLDRAHPDLSIRRRCTLLSISRSGVYRCARPGNDDDDLGLMRRIDELFLAGSSTWWRIMDWASRAVLSWRLSNTMDTSFCVAALEQALSRFGRPEI